MSVRHGLLAILAARPSHGYGLKSSFEESTARTWPLNVGQVYSTLRRLQRDGLVEPDGPGTEDRRAWRITPEGRAVLDAWYGSPVSGKPARDELAIKVLLAIADPAVDAQEVIQRQRVETVRRLQAYTREKRRLDPESELPLALLLDALILQTDAEARWLNLCEERLGPGARSAP